MHSATRLRASALLVAGFCVLAACGDAGTGVASSDTRAAATQDVQARLGELTVADGYVREPASPSVAAAYLTVTNGGDADDRLTCVSSDVAGQAMPMTETTEGGVGSMTPLDDVVVPAHGSFRFSPGRAHLMLEELTTTPAVGDTVQLTLTFQRAGALTVELPVEPIGTSDPGMSDMPDMPGNG